MVLHYTQQARLAQSVERKALNLVVVRLSPRWAPVNLVQASQVHFCEHEIQKSRDISQENSHRRFSIT